MIKRIVLTGGPCAGKTTVLAKLEQDLTEKGYKVFVVPESATELIKSGIRPTDENGIGLYEFQKQLLIYQLQKEMLYERVANIFPSNKIVIIYDRGLLDNKAYVADNEFTNILKYVDKHLNIELNETNIVDRYDMVLHLVTSALGYSNNYTLENNKARTETKEEAIKVDRRTLSCWGIHPNLQVINSSDNFDEKIDNVLNTIHNFLGNPVQIIQERKFLVGKLNIKEILNKLDYVKTRIEQYYIDTNSNDAYERRLRKVTHEGGVNYYYCVQSKDINGIKRIISEQKITEEQFNKVLNNSKIISNIDKIRLSFVYNNQYFKLDLLDNENILEVISSSSNEISFPSGIQIIDEVTNDYSYQNINIGRIDNVETSKQKVLNYVE